MVTLKISNKKEGVTVWVFPNQRKGFDDPKSTFIGFDGKFKHDPLFLSLQLDQYVCVRAMGLTTIWEEHEVLMDKDREIVLKCKKDQSYYGEESDDIVDETGEVVEKLLYEIVQKTCLFAIEGTSAESSVYAQSDFNKFIADLKDAQWSPTRYKDVVTMVMKSDTSVLPTYLHSLIHDSITKILSLCNSSQHNLNIDKSTTEI